MSYFEAIVLAIVQGLTEFLPISSSAHLILVPILLGWDDQGLAFDVAVHFGSLMAVCIYFRADIVSVTSAWLRSVTRLRRPDTDAMLGWNVILATIPAGLAGLLLHDFVNNYLRDPLVIAASTAFFGVLLWLADRKGGIDDERRLGWRTALLIGMAQILALIPGTSRSGITITAGLALGLSRQAAARFSFLMAIPVIALAGLLETRQLLELDTAVQWDVILTGVFFAGVSAYLCIRVFLRLLQRLSMLPFMLYRLVLAAVLFVVFA